MSVHATDLAVQPAASRSASYRDLGLSGVECMAAESCSAPGKSLSLRRAL